ncbi:MAG: GDP-mannose 4,6-dehydratase [Patescibacteria group bacterium]
MKNILITGISGFAGSFLAEYLVSRNKGKISGTYLEEASLGNIQNVKTKVNLFKLNLTEEKKVFDIVLETKPDFIFHLAALTSPKASFDNPFETIQNNVKAQLNLLEAVRKLKLLNTRILVISSAEVYGIVEKKDLPIDEDTKFIPASPYAVSKITQDFLALQYFLSYDIKIIRIRPFNHIGPRQSPNFVVSAFAKKIAEIEKGKTDNTFFVGNLDSKRDFTDVRDMVTAYSLAIEKGEAGEVYNIGSGKSYAISQILDKMLSLSKTKIKVRVDESLFRPSDNPDLLCDRSKFTNLTGWEPEIPIDRTLKDTLDYWRNII